MSFVYVIAANEAGPCKIGTTSGEVMARLSELQVGNHETLIAWSAWHADDGRKVEARAHVALAAKRIRGEWFRVSVAEAENAVVNSYYCERCLPFSHLMRCTLRRVLGCESVLMHELEIPMPDLADSECQCVPPALPRPKAKRRIFDPDRARKLKTARQRRWRNKRGL